MKLYIPPRLRRGVIEKYVDLEVTTTPQSIEKPHLLYEELANRRLKKRFNNATKGKPWRAVVGLATGATWNLAYDPGEYITYQTKQERRTNGQNRWTDTLNAARAIRSGKLLPRPLLIHPDLSDLDGVQLIDGARRIAAHALVHTASFEVAMVVPA